ncbi:alanine racemase C-terminal domain-containing protein [Pseudolysinimonas sp.]|uniref:alanine racemase C-terminal domain-containing protein n=1 Tax=Pseudolysinimonas sp. TaxID=2680009 RepID=UPI00286AB427|nr:alanine racemase C-terminal domain-containing protein [Pseudolysinimonas sp.]
MPGIRRRALIDLDAFLHNGPGEVLDARADAYGHGLEVIAPTALKADVRQIVVSNEQDATVAIAAGFRREAVHIAREPLVADPRAYGLGHDGRPVMSLIGEIVALKRVPPDAGVSYGYTYRTSVATTLALVALGYADGVPRLASNRVRVLVGDATFPLVGRIAMDQFVLDVGDAAIELGSDAVLFGDPARGEPSVLEWSGWTERDPLALTAGIASRVVRSAR